MRKFKYRISDLSFAFVHLRVRQYPANGLLLLVVRVKRSANGLLLLVVRVKRSANGARESASEASV